MTHIAHDPRRIAGKLGVRILALLPSLEVSAAWSRAILLVVCGFHPLGLGRHHLPPQLWRTFPEGLTDLFIRSLCPDFHPYEATIIDALPLDKADATSSEFIQELHGNLGLFASRRTKIRHLVLLDGFLECHVSGMNARGRSSTAHHIVKLQFQIRGRILRPRLGIGKRKGIFVGAWIWIGVLILFAKYFASD